MVVVIDGEIEAGGAWRRREGKCPLPNITRKTCVKMVSSKSFLLGWFGGGWVGIVLVCLFEWRGETTTTTSPQPFLPTNVRGGERFDGKVGCHSQNDRVREWDDWLRSSSHGTYIQSPALDERQDGKKGREPWGFTGLSKIWRCRFSDNPGMQTVFSFLYHLC